MARTVTANTLTPVVCGLRAHTMSISVVPNRMDISGWGDKMRPRYIDLTPPTYNMQAVFVLPHKDCINGSFEYSDIFSLFPVGEGNFIERSLGSADVCQFCGTAWLPGTLSCPSCGGTTNHFDKAIEYQSDNLGIITHKSWQEGATYIELRIDVEFTKLTLTDNIWRTFEFGLWRNAPALWVCRFCGHVVYGKTSDCPGCGGKRQPVTKFATQQRTCLYCGTRTLGGYACPSCNMRLMAPFS